MSHSRPSPSPQPESAPTPHPTRLRCPVCGGKVEVSRWRAGILLCLNPCWWTGPAEACKAIDGGNVLHAEGKPMIKPGPWQASIFQSGSTIVTNNDVVLYVYDHQAIVTGKTLLTDAELDAKKFEYAQWIAAVLNSAKRAGESQ